jgi:hypothetical protein
MTSLRRSSLLVSSRLPMRRRWCLRISRAPRPRRHQLGARGGDVAIAAVGAARRRCSRRRSHHRMHVEQAAVRRSPLLGLPAAAGRDPHAAAAGADATRMRRRSIRTAAQYRAGLRNERFAGVSSAATSPAAWVRALADQLQRAEPAVWHRRPRARQAKPRAGHRADRRTSKRTQEEAGERPTSDGADYAEQGEHGGSQSSRRMLQKRPRRASWRMPSTG